VGGLLWAELVDLLWPVAAIHSGSLRRIRSALSLSADSTEREALRARAAPSAPSGVAVLNLSGIIRPGSSLLDLLFGGGSGGLAGFRSDFRSAVGNDEIKGIVLNIDSPGGSTDLVPETAAEVRDARGSKPIVAIANTMAASAAYWIGAQADEFIVTPSGEAGSIGVFAMHEDYSAMDETMGVRTTLISAGKYKTEANPFEPLSDEAKAAIQGSVDEFYSMFVNDVAKGRDVKASDVRNGFGEGRVLTARAAVDAGMADRVATFEDTVSRVGDARRRARIASESVEDVTNRARAWHELLLARER
jgi:signal peptide peptidase SppA